MKNLILNKTKLCLHTSSTRTILVTTVIAVLALIHLLISTDVLLLFDRSPTSVHNNLLYKCPWKYKDVYLPDGKLQQSAESSRSCIADLRKIVDSHPGCAVALRDLAVLTFMGIGTEKNHAVALDLVSRAIAANLVTAQTDKALMLILDAVPTSAPHPTSPLHKLMNNDNHNEDELLRKLQYRQQQAGLKLLRDAADDKNDPIAMISLFEMYMSAGNDVLPIKKVDTERALHYFKRSMTLFPSSVKMPSPQIRLFYKPFHNLDRRQQHLHPLAQAGIDVAKAPGFEIGGSFRPFLKHQDSKVITIDHDTKENLSKKYVGLGQSALAEIQDVDVIWRGQNFVETIFNHTKGEKIHWGVSSHVMEHMPNLLQFFNDVATFTDDEHAALSQSIPDKRRVFDFLRPLTTYDKIVKDFTNKNTRHSEAMIMEYYAKVAMPCGQLTITEAQRCPPPKGPHHGPGSGEGMLAWHRKGEYVDIHNLVTSPINFLAILNKLIANKMLKQWKIESFSTGFSEGHEFYVTLSKKGSRAYDSMNQDDLEQLSLLENSNQRFTRYKNVMERVVMIL